MTPAVACMARTRRVIMDSQDAQPTGLSSDHTTAQAHESRQDDEDEAEEEEQEDTEGHLEESIGFDVDGLVGDVIDAFAVNYELEETQVMEGSETGVDNGPSTHLNTTGAEGPSSPERNLQTLESVTHPNKATCSPEYQPRENTTRRPSNRDKHTTELEHSSPRARSELVSVDIVPKTGMLPVEGAHPSYSESTLDLMATSPPLNDAGVAAATAERSLKSVKRRAEDAVGIFQCTRSKKTRSEEASVNDASPEERSDRGSIATIKKRVTLEKSSAQMRVLLTLGTAAWKRKVTVVLEKINLKVIANVPYKRTDFLCVAGEPELKTTAKLLGTLVRNKPVVTSQWIDDCAGYGRRLDPHGYIHSDLVDTMAVDRSGLFAGATFIFTEALVARYRPAGWKDVQFLMKEAGARKVHTSKSTKLALVEEDWICMGDAEDDPVATTLSAAGFDVYHKDLLTQSILSGEVDLDSDMFKLDV